MYIMFLKQEKLETDDFEKKSNLVLKRKKRKRKYCEKCFKWIYGNGKNFTKYFCIFFCFRAF